MDSLGGKASEDGSVSLYQDWSTGVALTDYKGASESHTGAVERRSWCGSRGGEHAHHVMKGLSVRSLAGMAASTNLLEEVVEVGNQEGVGKDGRLDVIAVMPA